MRYQDLLFTGENKLSYKENRIWVNGEVSVTLEDINCIIMENRSSTLSTYLLSEIANYDITMIFTDEKHMPVNILLPLSDHTSRAGILRKQIAIKSVLKKQLWQQIIMCKIHNQAKCLEQCNIEESETIMRMKNRVKTNDNTNIEAEVAKKYFHYLFGNDFYRKDETNIINGTLNYGYSIIRSIIARKIVAHGLEPSLGIWHHSELNSFNLADDLIEPFRPFVDLEVFNMKMEKELDNILTNENKSRLIAIQYKKIVVDNKHFEVGDMIDNLVVSYANICKEKTQQLSLPFWEDE